MAPVKSTKLSEAVIPTGQTFNRFVEASNRVLDGPGVRVPQHGRSFRQEVLVTNQTGADIEFNKIIGLGNLKFTAGSNLYGILENPCFDSISTQTLEAKHFGAWGITAHAIKSGKSGLVIVGGITACEVNITDEDHLYADVFNSTDGKDRLTSATAGHAKILNRDTGTGSRNCVVFIGQQGGRLYGTLQADLEASSSSTIANPTVPVWDDGWLTTNFELVSGTKVVCDFIVSGSEGKWVVTGASACESETP